MTENKIIYSINDLIEMFQFSRKTIRKYIKSGELRAVLIGNQYRIKKEDLDAFIDSKKKVFEPKK
ncbi:MAG: helix-turn-helix domain-containing protein [Bacilli bacterium]|nr:helix-turn-helix domain-containing protein [Bacilli bacterium]